MSSAGSIAISSSFAAALVASRSTKKCATGGFCTGLHYCRKGEGMQPRYGASVRAARAALLAPGIVRRGPSLLLGLQGLPNDLTNETMSNVVETGAGAVWVSRRQPLGSQMRRCASSGLPGCPCVMNCETEPLSHGRCERACNELAKAGLRDAPRKQRPAQRHERTALRFQKSGATSSIWRPTHRRSRFFRGTLGLAPACNGVRDDRMQSCCCVAACTPQGAIA
jgi:hypothetical protein